VLPFMPVLVIVAFVTSMYISFVSFTQRNETSDVRSE
jgi:hypothetical protein